MVAGKSRRGLTMRECVWSALLFFCSIRRLDFESITTEGDGTMAKYTISNNYQRGGGASFN